MKRFSLELSQKSSICSCSGTQFTLLNSGKISLLKSFVAVLDSGKISLSGSQDTMCSEVLFFHATDQETLEVSFTQKFFIASL